MSLAEERRVIAGGITAARKSQQLVSDLQSLETQRRQIGALNELERRGAQPAKVGRAVYKPPATGTGGIASPVTELVTGGREYYPDHYNLYSNDTMLSVEIRPLKSLKMKDADGSDVVFNFQQPPQVS